MKQETKKILVRVVCGVLAALLILGCISVLFYL